MSSDNATAFSLFVFLANGPVLLLEDIWTFLIGIDKDISYPFVIVLGMRKLKSSQKHTCGTLQGVGIELDGLACFHVYPGKQQVGYLHRAIYADLKT